MRQVWHGQNPFEKNFIATITCRNDVIPVHKLHLYPSALVAGGVLSYCFGWLGVCLWVASPDFAECISLKSWDDFLHQSSMESPVSQ